MLRSQSLLRSTPFSLARAVPALSTALLWCALAASVAFWVLHFPRESTTVLPAVNTAAPVAAIDTAQVARALGQKQAVAEVPADSNRFQLLGVIASGSGQGSALIAIDGQPPKAWRVGQALQEGVYLQKLAPREAWLGDSPSGAAQWTLRMSGPEGQP